MNGEGEGIQMTGKNQTFAPFNPVCQNWVAQSVECIAMKEVIEVNILGSYKEAEGKFSYRFYPDGEITVSYNFTLLQDISPGKPDLYLPFPISITNWNGNVKDIGMPTRKIISALWKEQQKAFDETLPVSGLAGPSKEPTTAWSFDQTANGIPIFSVQPKRNIYTAVLSGNGKERISVLSDGTQHFRAWIDGNNIRFLVADYNNAGRDTYLVSHAQKGYRPLRKGDSIKGVVRLRL